ncbi:MAG: acyl-CoA thioesterase [Bradyrhizobiaceae bacterium]|nr:acyl-CoA thioesterase [Bradyrhizobiaceae bacterium]
MLTNSRALRIEWGDCDPAGIVFYPRYFEMFDTSTTALFERALGMKKSEFLKAYDAVGYAMVDTRARFRSPTRFGDDVVIETTITELKPSSFSVQHRLMKDDVVAVEAFETRVWVGRDPDDPDKFKAKPFPSEMMERLKRK